MKWWSTSSRRSIYSNNPTWSKLNNLNKIKVFRLYLDINKKTGRKLVDRESNIPSIYSILKHSNDSNTNWVFKYSSTRIYWEQFMSITSCNIQNVRLYWRSRSKKTKHILNKLNLLTNYSLQGIYFTRSSFNLKIFSWRSAAFCIEYLLFRKLCVSKLNVTSKIQLNYTIVEVI